MREFIGPDLFDVLLTENPSRWPWHAWINFPLVPLTLIASRTPLVLWTASPLVPLLFSWPSTVPANAATSAALRLAAPARPQLWPPPPVLVCVLFPSIRKLYTHLRQRIATAVVPLPPARPPQAQQQAQQQPQQQPLQQQPQQQQQQQQGREAGGGGGPQRFGLQIREHFDLEIRAHIRVGPAAPAAAPVAGAVGAGAGGGGDAVANNNPDEAADLPAQGQQDQQQQQQQQRQEEQQQPEQPQQPQPEPPQQQQQQQQPQPQPQEPAADAAAAAAPMNDEDLAAAAARTIRLTTASFGRLVGGALAMPTIARMMGAALLRLSHVLPLVRAIIAPREQQQLPQNVPAAAAVGLLGFWNNLQRSRLFGVLNGQRQQQQQQQQVLWVGGGKTGALGARVLGGLFLSTSQEWAMSDPVWYAPLP